MKNIKDYDLQDLKDELVSIGEKGFRAEQIFKWIYQEKVKSFDEMTNLSLELREKLKQNYTICNYNILKKLESSDGTKKYLFDILDGNAIESVLMEYHYGKSICVSSQVGCKMGCKFCASTGIPFIRSLSAGEIVEQILAVEQDTGDKISNVVFMGIGEPLDNYDNVIKAIRILNNPKGLNIGARHISVSTSGLVPRIYDLANENIQCTLSVSLHASNDEKRSSMMPVNNAYNIEELMKACRDYIAITNKRISFEYANSVVYKKAQSKDELKGMGTTLDVCLIYNSRIYIGHVGDSRVYRIRKEFMRRLTKDHSYVQTLVDDGTITKEEAYRHPKKNMLMKALGCVEKVEPDVYTKTFIKDDIILMCSDGLTNMIREENIYEIIKQDKENAIENLVKQANDNGGLDNITVVIIM